MKLLINEIAYKALNIPLYLAKDGESKIDFELDTPGSVRGDYQQAKDLILTIIYQDEGENLYKSAAVIVNSFNERIDLKIDRITLIGGEEGKD